MNNPEASLEEFFRLNQITGNDGIMTYKNQIFNLLVEFNNK